MSSVHGYGVTVKFAALWAVPAFVTTRMGPVVAMGSGTGPPGPVGLVGEFPQPQAERASAAKAAQYSFLVICVSFSGRSLILHVAERETVVGELFAEGEFHPLQSS